MLEDMLNDFVYLGISSAAPFVVKRALIADAGQHQAVADAICGFPIQS
jgi:hypothetical protein